MDFPLCHGVESSSCSHLSNILFPCGRETRSPELEADNSPPSSTAIYEGRLKSSWTHLITPSRNLWRCDDGLFFEVPPLASDALLTTLHPLLENVLQTVCSKLQEDSGTGGFLPRSSLFMVGKAQKSHGARSWLYGGYSNGVPSIPLSETIATLAVCSLALSWRLLRHPRKGSFKTTVTQIPIRWPLYVFFRATKS
jgi:hypothetical protein